VTARSSGWFGGGLSLGAFLSDALYFRHISGFFPDEVLHVTDYVCHVSLFRLRATGGVGPDATRCVVLIQKDWQPGSIMGGGVSHRPCTDQVVSFVSAVLISEKGWRCPALSLRLSSSMAAGLTWRGIHCLAGVAVCWRNIAGLPFQPLGMDLVGRATRVKRCQPGLKRFQAAGGN